MRRRREPSPRPRSRPVAPSTERPHARSATLAGCPAIPRACRSLSPRCARSARVRVTLIVGSLRRHRRSMACAGIRPSRPGAGMVMRRKSASLVDADLCWYAVAPTVMTRVWPWWRKSRPIAAKLTAFQPTILLFIGRKRRSTDSSSARGMRSMPSTCACCISIRFVTGKARSRIGSMPDR